jgi:putative Ca2+/H+ antiporter (TMEM165/GDT1 family)
MNKRAIGVILILIGIVDILLANTILQAFFDLPTGILQYWDIIQYIPHVASAAFVIFGLRLVFQDQEDEYTKPTQGAQARAVEQQKRSVPKPRTNREAIQMIQKHLKEQGVKPPASKQTYQEPLFPASEKMQNSLQGLTPEQQKYVKGFSWAAFVNPFIWAVMNGQGAFAAFLFVPMFNFFIWLALAFKGRHIAWAGAKDRDFDKFESRQRGSLIVGLLLTGMFFFLMLMAEGKGY